jgi:hypothetical protein
MKNAARPRVIVTPDLTEFFREEVSGAQESLGIDLPESAEYYLVQLLCEYSRREGGPTPGDEALAMLYKRALEAELAERIRMLKELGDMALYVSGFFAEFIEQSLVDLDYWVAMGGNAYHQVSEIIGAHRSALHTAELYRQLGRRFVELVDLLNEVADHSREGQKANRDVLRLYSRWLRTRSERVRRLLIAEGIIPRDDEPDPEMH